MLNCVAAIQFDEEKKVFVLVSGKHRVEIKETDELQKFVEDAPEITPDVLLGLSDVWFPKEQDGIEDAEFETIKEEN